MSEHLSPQDYGRRLERLLVDKYGWMRQPGSGNQYHRPSDALGGLALDTPFQIEIKTQRWEPATEQVREEHGVSRKITRKPNFRLNLASVWEKLASEAILSGRIPVLVAALSLEWTTAVVSYVDAEAWGIVEGNWMRETVNRWWSDDPTRWSTGAVIYRRSPPPKGTPPNKTIQTLVPYWVRCPIERVPGLVGTSQ